VYSKFARHRPCCPTSNCSDSIRSLKQRITVLLLSNTDLSSSAVMSKQIGPVHRAPSTTPSSIRDDYQILVNLTSGHATYVSSLVPCANRLVREHYNFVYILRSSACVDLSQHNTSLYLLCCASANGNPALSSYLTARYRCTYLEQPLC